MEKDLRAEMRGRETMLAMALIALLVVVIGLLAFHHQHEDAHARSEVASGILWMGLSFAAALGLARAFGAEKDRGTLDTLLTLPVERGSIYVGKTMASFAIVLFVALLTVPLYLVASGDALPAGAWGLIPVFVLGALGLAATGTMLSALAAETRGRDLLLPVLLFPLIVPLLIATVHATHDVLSGQPFSAWRAELMVLAGYDLAFLAAATLLFEAAVEG